MCMMNVPESDSILMLAQFGADAVTVVHCVYISVDRDDETKDAVLCHTQVQRQPVLPTTIPWVEGD